VNNTIEKLIDQFPLVFLFVKNTLLEGVESNSRFYVFEVCCEIFLFHWESGQSHSPLHLSSNSRWTVNRQETTQFNP